jgi:Mn-dependent DtxR family transcriptional regulator
MSGRRLPWRITSGRSTLFSEREIEVATTSLAGQVHVTASSAPAMLGRLREMGLI